MEPSYFYTFWISAFQIFIYWNSKALLLFSQYGMQSYVVLLTWMLYNCCRFFAHEHQIWHQWMAPMYNSTVCLLIQIHSKGQLHLEERLNFQFLPSLYHYDNVQPSIRMGIFAVKIVARTEMKWKKKTIITIECEEVYSRKHTENDYLITI